MIKLKVNIKDYQVIKDAELVFEPGITAIVGNSNNGKSSLIRAIEAAINNKGGNGFINYDADFCEVRIEDLGHTIIWTKHKKQGKSTYSIDGVVLNKIGQKQLDEVGTVLNMSEVNVNDEKFRLNFWKQMEFPFLVGKTPYQLFDFISKSNEQEMVLELQNISAENFKDIVDSIKGKVAQVDLKTKDIKNIESEIEKLDKFIEFNIDRYDSLVIIYDNISKKMAELDDITVKHNKANEIYSYATEKLKKVEAIIEKLDKANTLYNKLYSLIEEFDLVSNNVTVISNKKAVAEQKELLLSKKVASIEKIIETYNINNKLYNDYISLISQVELVNSDIDSRKKAIKVIEEKTKKIEKELLEFKVCPVCNSSLLGGHSHD